MLRILLALTFSLHLFANDGIRPGDIVLVSFDCYSCRLIESETNSLYSHSALILSRSETEVTIAQALGNVHTLELKTFLARTKLAHFFRLHELDELYNLETQAFHRRIQKLQEVFKNSYQGHGFDSAFLWGNTDTFGRELLYCSEFVAKIMNEILEIPFRPIPMDFSKNRDAWDRKFKGQTPQNLEGLSPQDLANSALTFPIFP